MHSKKKNNYIVLTTTFLLFEDSKVDMTGAGVSVELGNIF